MGELTSLSDDKIAALAPEIAGDGFHTETVAQNGIKFIKATALSEDSGGKFTLIQYITVTSKKEYTLSFYTASGENTDYAEKVFSTLSFGGGRCEENREKALRLYFYGTHRDLCAVRRIYSLYAHTGYKG